MTDTLVHQPTGTGTSPPPVVERPDSSFRSAFEIFPVLSLDGKRSTWVGRFGKGTLGIAGPLSLGGRKAHASINDARMISASEMRHGPSSYVTSAERKHRRAAGYVAFGTALLLLGMGAGPLGRTSEAGTPGPARLGRPVYPTVTTAPTDGGPGTVRSTELLTAPVQPTPADPTAADVGEVDSTPADPGPGDPTPGPATPGEQVATQENPPPPTVAAAQAFVQVLVAALAGVDLGLGVRLGDNTCVGVRIATTVVGCTPQPRAELGATAEIERVVPARAGLALRPVTAKPVFISYTRRGGSKHALALHAALDDLAFLDSDDIVHGANFVDTLIDAILGAKVIVVFIDETYFTRQYCWFEYEIATHAHRMLVQRGATEAELATALDHLVIARPDDFPDELVDSLHLPLRERNWAPASRTADLRAVILDRLARNRTVRQRLLALQGDEEALRADLKNIDTPGFSELPEATTVRPPVIPLHKALKGRRSELWGIHHELATGMEGAKHPRTVILNGMGGVGKTTLAAEYVYRFGPEHYPGGLFWVNAGENVEEKQYEILGKLKSVPDSLQAFNAAGRDLSRELAVALEEPALASRAEGAHFVRDRRRSRPPGAGEVVPRPGRGLAPRDNSRHHRLPWSGRDPGEGPPQGRRPKPAPGGL